MPDQVMDRFGKAVLDASLPVPAGLTGPHGNLATRRFNVYRNNVVAGLNNALGDSFPVVRKLVGDAFFTAMASVFVRAHLPKTPLMMFYGDDFPAFLATFPPVTHLPYLPDVARLELARRQAFHAADAIPAGTGALAGIPEPDLPKTRFRLHPSLRLISSDWPVFSIWRFNSTQDQSPLPPHGEDVLIARPFADVEMRVLPPGARAFLHALNSGLTLAESLEKAAIAAPVFDISAQIGAVLQTNILVETYQYQRDT